MFAEKLDFLMKLTGAQNSALGRAAHVDASTVSRLRAGKRDLPKKQNFLPAMCDYFSRSISSAYQRQSAGDTICVGKKWPEDSRQASAMIYAWLTGDQPPEDQRIPHLVSGIAQFSYKAPSEPMENSPAESVSTDETYYFGNIGKREAVIRFLCAVIAGSKPRTLLLYSDESMEWLNEDPIFTRRWASLMRSAIQNGNRIRIIHTIGRTLDEMMEALNKWIGVYMTGAIEPYYCPRLRDGITRRTLFIAPDLAAVTATSVGENVREALNQYVTEPSALKALEREFQRYMDLCQPLMRILKNDAVKTERNLLAKLTAAEGDAFIAQAAPIAATMPEAVARSIAARLNESGFMRQWNEAVSIFQNSLMNDRIYEIIPLYTGTDFDSGNARLSAFFTLNGREIAYTKQEYARHLIGMAEALATHANYRVLLPQSPFLQPNIALYHKKGAGTIIARTDDYRILFAINEPIMTTAFGEFLTRQVADAEKSGYRTNAIKRLYKAAESVIGHA